MSQAKTVRKGRIEVRYDDEGNLDEVLLYAHEYSSAVLLHMEQLDLHVFWMRLQNTAGEDDLVLHLRSRPGDEKSKAWYDSEPETKKHIAAYRDNVIIAADCEWD